MKVIRHNKVLAESEDTIVIEGNHYFPPNSINQQYFKKSDTRTKCARKGEASYYHIVVGQEEEKDAAWYYPAPKSAARKIKDYVAFYKGVEKGI